MIKLTNLEAGYKQKNPVLSAINTQIEAGNIYGLLGSNGVGKTTTIGKLGCHFKEEGKNVILEIDVNGARQVKENCPDAVLIMLLPPSFAEQEKRLRGRGTESEEVIQKRMAEARIEIETFPKYDYVVINRDGGVDRAAQDVLSILHAEKMRTLRNADIPETFFQ